MSLTLTLEPGQQVWISSDFHYQHRNIVEGVSSWAPGRGQRPFPTLEAMNATLVENINTLVLPNHILICLGDFAFGREQNIRDFRAQIACKHLMLILGNHDSDIGRNRHDLRALFTRVGSYLELKIKLDHENDFSRFVLFHFPLATWHGIGRGVMHLHGHTHRRPEERFGPGKMMDVGIDGSETFQPYLLDDIAQWLRPRPIAGLFPNDYHTEEDM